MPGMTIYISIERDRDARSSAAGARFRVRVRAAEAGIAILSSTRACQSVTRAKDEAEALLGKLQWREGEGDVRFRARVEVKNANA